MDKLEFLTYYEAALAMAACHDGWQAIEQVIQPWVLKRLKYPVVIVEQIASQPRLAPTVYASRPLRVIHVMRPDDSVESEQAIEYELSLSHKAIYLPGMVQRGPVVGALSWQAWQKRQDEEFLVKQVEEVSKICKTLAEGKNEKA